MTYVRGVIVLLALLALLDGAVWEAVGILGFLLALFCADWAFGSWNRRRRCC